MPDSPIVSKVLSHFTKTSGEFRSAANENNRNVSKIVKDVSSVLSSNKGSFSDLGNAISDLKASSSEASSRIIQTNNLLQESINVQNQILSQLRSLGDSLKENNNKTTSLFDRLLGGVGAGLKTTALAGGAALAANTLTKPPGGGENLGEGDKVEAILKTIKGKESGGKYDITSFAEGKGSTASGGYQFADATWQEQAKKAGVDISQYKRAKDAPPEVQDQVARAYVKDILARNQGDVSSVPREWYAGPKGYLTEKELKVNKGLTLEQYSEDWMKRYSQNAGAGVAGAAAPAGAPQTGIMGGVKTEAPYAGSPMSGDATSLAESMIGKHERLNNQEISSFLSAGGVSMNPAVEAWCAAFVNSALAQSGQKGSGSQVATSFLNWGTPVTADKIQRGDVIIETRGKQAGQTGGHVGIATGLAQGSKIEMISGNQSNQVSKSWVDTSSGSVEIRRGSGTGGAAPNMGALGAPQTGAQPDLMQSLSMGGAVGGMGMGGMPGMGMMPGMDMGMGMMPGMSMRRGMDPFMALGGIIGGGRGAAIGGLLGLGTNLLGNVFGGQMQPGDNARRNIQMNTIRDSAEERESLVQAQARASIESRNATEESKNVINQFGVSQKPSDYNADRNPKSDWWADLANAFPELKSAVKFSA